MRTEAFALMVLTTAVLAQPPAPPKPSFDVVSIRPGSRTPTSCPGGAFTAIGLICGGPGSQDPERFTGKQRSVAGSCNGPTEYRRFKSSVRTGSHRRRMTSWPKWPPAQRRMI